MRSTFAAAAILLQLLICGAASACSIPRPAGEVILTINGLIENCTDGLELNLDLAMLEKLPQHTVKTANPWEIDAVTYEGVLLRDLLEFAGAHGDTIVVTALNDFRADISIADTKGYDVILAYKRDGQLMPVRDKGPLFVVFPFTDEPGLATETYYAQSVWQVSRITVK